MASLAVPPSFLCVVVFFIFSSSSFGPAAAQYQPSNDDYPLRQGFYSQTCPRAEEIVRDIVTRSFQLDYRLASGLIRLHFHDCFVRGCDASILLDITPTFQPVEKMWPGNGITLRGLGVIDEAKLFLELECPGVVSCADTLAFAARDAAVLFGLPSYGVPAGRRDGRNSSAAEVSGNLPPPTASVDLLTGLFASKGFTKEEMVTLLGAHSVGAAHCAFFIDRLYSFAPGLALDPSMDLNFADYLKQLCPEMGEGGLVGFLTALGKDVPFNHSSQARLDGSYYAHLLQGKALLASDQTLMADPDTRSIVEYLASHPEAWATKFADAMVKVGKVGVLTGDQGEVRICCRLVKLF